MCVCVNMGVCVTCMSICVSYKTACFLDNVLTYVYMLCCSYFRR